MYTSLTCYRKSMTTRMNRRRIRDYNKGRVLIMVEGLTAALFLSLALFGWIAYNVGIWR